MTDRLTWPKFGAALNNTVCWSIAEDVFIDLTHPELKTRQQRVIDSESYALLAHRWKWPFTDILQIRESDNQMETFFQIFNRREATKEAELQSSYASRIAAINAEYDANMAKIHELYPREQAPVKDKEIPPSTSTPTPAPQALGIRGRFNSKLAEQKKKEDAAPPPTSNGLGLAARMKQLKQDKQDTEQESTLFVSNISDESTENDLRAALGTEFNVRRINFVRKGGDKHAGVGFVVLSSMAEAERCLEALNGMRLNYVVLTATFSKPKNSS